MKGKHIALIAAVVTFILTAAAVILYINYDSGSDRTVMELYFMNGDGTSIVSETREMRFRDDVELVEEVLDSLRKGPGTSKHGRIMPRETKVRRIEFDGMGAVTVDFSEPFLSEDASKNVLGVYAVTKSLCSTGIVNSVCVTVEGNEITDRDGNGMGFVAASDIYLETEEYLSEMRSVTLYFRDRKSGKLGREVRSIKITDQQPMEQYIINELIKGTNDKSLESLLSRKTVLLSVDVEDNICYVNFKSNFLKENAGDSDHEKLIIYSIVNSLSELQTISRVQFYMDGKRVDSFGSFDIKGYISSNTDIIAEEET